jgi:glycosyltransferase involved in cell wall biosynthesis
LYNKGKIDIVHAYFFWPIFLSRILKKFYKFRLIENRENHNILPLLYNLILRLTNNTPDKVICVSNAILNETKKIEKIQQDRLIKIYNGVEINKKLKKQIKKGKKLNLIYVGRLSKEKGVRYLIEAFNKIYNDQLRLLIVGDGKEREKLEKLAGEKIEFLGYRRETYSLLNSSDIFILPSLTEGCSISILEAMSLGKPIIATNVGGTPELIQDGKNGLLISSKDIIALKEAIEKLVKDKKLRDKFGKNNKNKIKEFDIKKVIKKYEKIYLG